MSSIFITGSADGLGRLIAETLLEQGHDLVLHARTRQRAENLADLAAGGAQVVIGDLSDREQVKNIADQIGAITRFDAIIHNAGVWSGRDVLPVNIIAPYLLTALLPLPRRLIFLNSSSHYGGRPELEGIDWSGRRPGSYDDSKLFVTTLAAVIAHLYPQVLCNAVDPGWVPTKMGCPSAPDDLELGHRTQEWLATSEGSAALFSGGYWHHQQRRAAHKAVSDPKFQEDLLTALATETGISLQHH